MRYVITEVMTPDGRAWIAAFTHKGPKGPEDCEAKGDNAVEALRRAELLEEDLCLFDQEEPTPVLGEGSTEQV